MKSFQGFICYEIIAMPYFFLALVLITQALKRLSACDG